MADDQHTHRATPLDYLQQNQVAWDRKAAAYAPRGERIWRSEPCWGIWNLPESQLKLLPEVSGKDTLELGCGTGYVSAWLAQRGARPVGLDLSANQLATARRLQEMFDLRYPLLRAAAEAVPLQAESFDLVISEYGAAIWSDPYRWIPEAARLLRPGGELIFLGNGAIFVLCEPEVGITPAQPALVRPYFGMHRFAWPDEQTVEFHLGHGDWIRLLRRNGFVIDDLIELQAPEGATTTSPFVTGEWARQWPSEEVWKAHKA